MSASPSKTFVVREALGVGASTACVLHCVLVPWLAAASALGAALTHELHMWLAITSLLFALPLFYALLKRTLPLWAGGVLCLGWSLLLAGLMFHSWEEPLTIVGGSLLFLAHIANLRAHRLRHRATQQAAKQASSDCCKCSHTSD